MKIAVVGAGIAGLAAAHELQRWAQVTLFEAQNRLGGHSDTHAILVGGRAYPVDSGFTAYDAGCSPGFGAWLHELGVVAQPVELSLGVHDVATGLEYGTGSTRALVGRARDLCSPRFLGLLRELRRFHRTALDIAPDDGRTLGEYLDGLDFSRVFRELHLLPVCRALWSVPGDMVETLSAAVVVARLRERRLLPIGCGPEWRVISGGSHSYVNAFVDRFSGRIRRGEAVRAIVRQPGQVAVRTQAGRQAFDAVVLACHGHEALALLEDPTREEREVLGAIRFRRCRRVVHSDAEVMPRSRKVWSSWNARIDSSVPGACQLTFWMNRLQALQGAAQLFVTLDPEQPLRDVWSSQEYVMPVLDLAARAAQRRRDEISGRHNTWYCGAWWGDGLQEDGYTSGKAVARALADAAQRHPRAVG